MTDLDLKADIIEALDGRPMAGGSIAWVLKAESRRVREVLDDLIDAEMIEKSRDGYQYQLTDKGRNPPPSAA